MLLNKEQIFASDDREYEIVDVPEWGEDGQVKISVMSSFAKDRYEESCIGKNGGENLSNIRARLVAASAVDEKGELLFSEKEIIKLGTKSGIVISRLFDVAQRINKFSDSDIDELAKN